MDEILVEMVNREKLLAVYKDGCVGPRDKRTEPSVGDSLPAPERFPVPEGIDAKHAALTMDGDPGRFARALEVFRKVFASMAIDLSDDLAKNDLASACRRLHNIRGSAAQLGALQLAKSAEALEDALRNGRLDVADEMDSFGAALRVAVPGARNQ
jgi:HPt (histidine-containing phosphotransfer) domain-containing protein